MHTPPSYVRTYIQQSSTPRRKQLKGWVVWAARDKSPTTQNSKRRVAFDYCLGIIICITLCNIRIFVGEYVCFGMESE